MENRERRRDVYPDQYGYWTEDPPPVELVPYGSPGQPVLGKYSSELVPARGPLPTLQNPGSKPIEGPRLQVLYPNYEGNRPMNWDSNRTGHYDSMLFPTQPGVADQNTGNWRHGADEEERAGSALAMYPYLPRNMHSYNGNDYDIYRLHSDYPDSYSNYERHLMEDIMAAAGRYDNSMQKLEGKIDSFTPRNPQSVKFKGRFDDR
jgi:hypothetical protein